MSPHTSPHPLDPLSLHETQVAADTVKRYVKAEKQWSSIRFNTITLHEPVKTAVCQYEASSSGTAPPPRTAFCIIQPPPGTTTAADGQPLYAVELWVRLSPGEPDVEKCRELPGKMPLLTPDDCFKAEAIAKADPKLTQLLKERYGIQDMESEVACDPWSVHEHGELKGRVVQLFLYKRRCPKSNQYAHPLAHVAVVDLDTEQVVRIEGSDDGIAINEEPNDYHRDLVKEFRVPPKPLNVVQPEGPTFVVDGNKVTWQNWSFRVGFNAREGLIMHQVGYTENGRLRPIMYRGSLVEMAVPYAEPRDPYYRKCAFDVGDYGLGNCANSLELGCDCLGHIQYFDAVLCNATGEPYTLKKAVCMHEEDGGLLYKHLDYRTGHAESRRSRRLVISFIATVVNYEYMFYWYLYLDGTITLEIKLTGELSTNALSPGEEHPEFGTLVDPHVNAQHHQHMFCARLDMAVDAGDWGATGGLQVVEVEAVAVKPGPGNPYNNAFRVQETVLQDEKTAQRISAPSSRVWIVRNPNVKNRLGGALGYKLLSSSTPALLAHPLSLIARKGAFATKNLWVTPYSQEELYPAGDYTVMSSGGEGLPQWTANNRDVNRVDVVLWHAFGVTHLVRPEDFPIMPCEFVSFSLKPTGFFGRNPAVDLPPE